ncbi:tRNA (adenosine(37)-N6)-dimethylallyltransferase MiaA [Niveispirillum sp.]|uniref:tRNA (adenosine(37)-N6)-dimethylallyltransferase MiaA n=1 Tax=Niveispirillum sp. TaxID=1917217 RepID=UPI001B43D9C3|nr:tRNA (adenosine(37)-N6)-dimethylallyltransferase MiaA [Niveispirillum sp.]MBP7336515.1 tRNA (adenosine(37)-N6)-dimethylallyltransferase MiaA [Niveispirillum sp.]
MSQYRAQPDITAPRPVLIMGGPTASGKSGLALAFAKRANGVVINADSMQVYADLRIVTARPSAADEAEAPHTLYGVVPASVRMSAARWRELALAEIDRAHAAGLLPIVVGGTGLYLRSLMQGLSDIPDIPVSVRQAAMDLQAEIGSPGLHARLAAIDPATASRLHPTDSQRLIRAWEVIQATGRSISDWQAAPPTDVPTHLSFTTLVVEPPRPHLYAQCDRRFLVMLAQGAEQEVAALMAQNLDPVLPACKALGVPEIAAILSGALDRETAITKAQQLTRNYAKRQLTWFRNQMPTAVRLDSTELASEGVFAKFYDRIMTGMTKNIAKTG